jgi:hypothetical protein
MSKVTKIETAVRYLLVCAILSSPLLPAQAQQTQTSGPQQDVSATPAPLFVQPNYEGDLRQHSFFAGNYRYPIQTGVGYNEQPLFYWKNPILQQIQTGSTPISTGLIGDNIDTTVQGSVPGLVTAAVAGAVIGGAAIGSTIAGNGAGTAASAASSDVTGGGVSQNVTGNMADGTQF